MSAKKTSKGRVRTQRTGAIRQLVPEKTVFDTSANSVPVDYIGGSANITLVNQGGAWNNRDGVVIHPIHLRLRALVDIGPNSEAVRLMVVRVNYDASTFTVAQVVQATGSPQSVISPPNNEYVGQGRADRRIEILYERVITGMQDWHGMQLVSADIPLGSSEHNLIRYPNAGGNVASTGALFLVWYGIQAFVSASGMWYNTRLTFLDA